MRVVENSAQRGYDVSCSQCRRRFASNILITSLVFICAC
jgi:hypothetical protein